MKTSAKKKTPQAKASDAARMKHSEIPEMTGDIVKIFTNDYSSWLVIPTNGQVKRNGEAVMGKGVALEFAETFSHFPLALGRAIKKNGANRLYIFPDYQVITFPTKHHWKDKSDLELMHVSFTELDVFLTYFSKHFSFDMGKVYIPRVGCRNGGLDWTKVKPMMDFWLRSHSHIVTIVNLEEEE